MNTDEHESGSGACEGNAAPYVLGALEEDERAAFRRHLQSCAVCREEVASLRAVASSLAAVAPAATAPPELKRRVMSTVRSEAREPELRARPERRPARAPAWRGALAFAALLLILAVVVVALDTGGSGGTRVISAQVLAPHASAQVSLTGDRAELTLAGMPQSAPGRVYEVWVKRSGAPQPTDALFTVTAAGDATVGVPGSIAGVSEVLVSSEPLGGSRVPTRAPVIVARLG
jgi:anti-sigma-K factor RskA